MPTTSNFGWTTPADTDLVKDGAAAIRTLGNGIDTSFIDLKGGTTGQVLSKASNTDLDFSWVAQDDSNAIQNALLTTTGDTIYASGASTPARLGIGSNGQVLTVAGGVPTWATPAGGGKVLQVVYADYDTNVTITSTNSYSDTGGTISITPSSTSSKVLILCALAAGLNRNSTAGQGGTFRLLRGATAVFTHQATSNSALFTRVGLGSSNQTLVYGLYAINYLDSPSTTSSVTYKLQGKVLYTDDSGSITCQSENTKSTMLALEIGA